MGRKKIAFGVADRFEMVEDVTTGERTFKYNIIKEFAGNRKIKNMFKWFEHSPYKKLVIVPLKGQYSSFASFRSSFCFELRNRVMPENYFTISAKKQPTLS